MRNQARRASVFATVAAAAVAAIACASLPATAGEDDATITNKVDRPHRVQLVTGDVVLVQDGNAIGFTPAPGREDIPVHVTGDGDHSLVVPIDAQRLISGGRLDRRLFDVTALASAESRKAYKDGFKVIVGYAGEAADARARVRDAGGTKVRRSLKSLNAEAVITPPSDLPKLWQALTTGSSTRRTTAGVDKIWLDGTVKAQLDVSVPQIGADKAWAAGYDGSGVKVAVLDTGVDQTHPDLVGQELVEKNFSTAADNIDRQGHGTHVASTIAGTGAKSGGIYKGVAPGAKLIDGKVLDDSGSGDESGIISAIDWAVAQGADIVSMSLGGPDSPGVEPLEQSVNTYTEQGVLFTIAAGNEGRDGDGTIGMPGSAEGALTVGAVDGSDKLAAFSSRGPRIGDGAIKPDVTAPGVDITAASASGNSIAQDVGENPEGYMTISGTSMATPHVAGAAAILKQQHPGWKAAELKGVLTGSAKDGGYTAFEQGSGRIQVDKAIEQGVYAAPASLSLGTAVWPHEDDEPITRSLTYRNAGTSDVVLDLAAAGKGPLGAAAPEGMFTIAPAQVTVPAGGSAEATLTVDTSVPAPDGRFSAAVTADGGGQSVRTAVAVEREVPSRTVTLNHLGRDGQAAKHFQTYVTELSSAYDNIDEYALDEHSDSTTLRLPVGEYTVNSMVIEDRSDLSKGLDWIAQPKLVVGESDISLDVDARTAEPVDISVPDENAVGVQAYMMYGVKMGYRDNRFGWRLGSYDNFRSAHLGPELPAGVLSQVWDADFAAGADTAYSLVFGGPTTRLSDGFTRKVAAADLARLDVGAGSPAPGKDGWLGTIGSVPGAPSGYSAGIDIPGAGRVQQYVLTTGSAKWNLGFFQVGDAYPNGWRDLDVYYSSPNTAYEGGKVYRTDFNTAVIGPVLDGSGGITRSANTLYAFMNLFADGDGHGGFTPPTETVATTLYRNGEKVGESDNPLSFASFPVPAEDAEYKLTTSITRSPEISLNGTRIDASWTFHSKEGDRSAPASTVRFHPEVDLRSTVQARRPLLMPVEVQGAAAGGNLESLTVEASYDGGRTWAKLPKVLDKYALRAPARGKGVALRAEIVDKQRNVSTIAVYDAFLGR